MIYTKNLQPDITLSEFAAIYFANLTLSNETIDTLPTAAKRHFAAAPEWVSRADGGIAARIGNKKLVVMPANENGKSHWRVVNTDTDELIVKSTAQTAGTSPDDARAKALAAV